MSTIRALLLPICLVLALWVTGSHAAADGTDATAELSNLILAIEQVFPSDQQGMAMYLAMRESGGDCSVRIIDTNNEISAGCWQVQPVWWGEVSSDVNEQDNQVWLIVQEHGWKPWAVD